jgi:hypothetical protein
MRHRTRAPARGWQGGKLTFTLTTMRKAPHDPPAAAASSVTTVAAAVKRLLIAQQTGQRPKARLPFSA